MRAIKKAGFTLVELSIVLVIVGLLIGGILVGQSLIVSAKLQNEVRKISQWSIAVTQFKDKFRQYAGDSNLFNTAIAPAGDNNGVSNILGACQATRVDELFSVWSHLSQAGMLKGDKYEWSSENYCAGNYKGIAPINDIEYKSPSEIASSKNGSNFGGKRYEYYIQNYYKYYDFLAIEKKLDDGVSSWTTGKISGSFYFTGGMCVPSWFNDEFNDSGKSSKEDLVCRTVLFFNQNEIITPN